MAKKALKIDLSALFPDDDDPVVELDTQETKAILTYTPPTHLTLSKRDCVCRACGGVTHETLGIFLEYHHGDTMRLERIPADADLTPYGYLKRRIDYAPPVSVGACPDCWFADALVQAIQPQSPPEIIL